MIDLEKGRESGCERVISITLLSHNPAITPVFADKFNLGREDLLLRTCIGCLE